VFVVEVKVSMGLQPFSPMGIDSAYTSQHRLRREICIDNPHCFQITLPGSSTTLQI
jgi:hypothetical protein